MIERPTLLIVDDEPSIVQFLERFANRQGFNVITRGDGRTTLSELHALKADVAMVDLQMPEVSGLDVLRAIRQTDPSCQVILMTGYAGIDTAIEAIKLGAMDYMSKPLDFDRLRQLLSVVRADRERQRVLFSSEREISKQLEFHRLIGRSPKMQELFGLICRFAPHVRTALITGETGTGKELVARALYETGPRASRKFLTINCSAVVDTLFESELFGHTRGAFTGATETKAGMFERADGGTLFLDEIGELPPPAQAKLLRTIETGEVQRVGNLDGRCVDVRLIAATNRDLPTEVAAGRFRGDLYYRLNLVELRVPPLRERREDIPYLTAAFVREFSGQFGKSIVGLTPTAERELMTAPWTGNVRELRNVIERACMICDGEFLSERELASLLPAVPHPGPGVRGQLPSLAPGLESGDLSERHLLMSAERDHIRRVLEETGGNKKATARLLGLSRRALYRRLDKLGLR
ncbi:MAG TPA: sigma-54 dependent transcriptional regulator [Vicinamibacterales bacterium]|jgi:DNA-binding NtrC family response regulator